MSDAKVAECIEVWRPAAHGYEVSNLGCVRNSSGRILKPWTHRSGHLYVSLGRGNKHQVHRLVIAAFHGSAPSEASECRHLNGCAADNRASNLAWGSRAQNIADLKNHSGRYARASTSDDVAQMIRSRFTGKHGEQTALAREFHLPLSVVNRIVNGRTYANPQR